MHWTLHRVVKDALSLKLNTHYRHSPTYLICSYAILYNQKFEVATLLKPTLNFSLELKAKSDEGGGRILLGDNTDGGTVTLRPVRFQCVGVWISAGISRIYIVFNHTYTQFGHAPGLPECHYCLSPGFSVLNVILWIFVLLCISGF
jgi:hypothetical protein